MELRADGTVSFATRAVATMWRKCIPCLATALIVSPGLSVVQAQAAVEAEIVSVNGKGDRRDSIQVDWIPAAPQQTVKPGGFVRTRDMSQMAILLPDRTQIRLNQNSQIQIKTLADAAEWNQSAIKLNSGRAWSQARPPTVPAGSAAPATRLTVETPSATLSIRGTDWELEVASDGRTQLAVLNGEVDIANDHGSLKVGAGQAAVAEIGKPPVRMLLANPAERIQWVTSWQVQPRRWAPMAASRLPAAVAALESGDYAAAAALLAAVPGSPEKDILGADLAMMQGDTARAVAVLRPHAKSGRDRAPATALLARVLLATGDQSSAESLLNQARETHSGEAELWLASAEAALFAGNAGQARDFLAKAITLAPGHADAFFALGSMETERENIRAANSALAAAIGARPGFARAHAERGTLHALAGDFAAGAESFARALEASPDDYLALCGRGLLALKRGQSQAALEDFLRAGVIEPKFARAWLYSAAAFYQLGETRRATEALDRAAHLDPRDPLPYVMRGMIAADRLELDSAVDAAREAQARMPFLKSLNQVLNNQKGNANVGSSLAAFGLEEWAHHYATSAYSPWWAGSHLFLADRHTPGFNKNSELFKGFITDPTVFGASQRQSSLVSSPGHYGRADLFLEQGDWRQNALIGTANGLVVEPWPTAYFVSGDLSNGESRLAADRSDGTNLTVGLGLRPHHALGAFLFGTRTGIKAQLRNPTLPDDPLEIDQTRLDLGMNLKQDSRNQFWIKSGTGRNSSRLNGMVATRPFGMIPLDRYQSKIRQNDFQFRHAFAPGEGSWLSWGYEQASQDKKATFEVHPLPALALAIAESNSLRSRDAYLVGQAPLAFRVTAELGAMQQRAEYRQFAQSRINGAHLPGSPAERQRDIVETNWRGGLRWQPTTRVSVAAVTQNWRRPASVGSLAPIETLGIAVNDSLVSNGGLYRRGRIQIDSEVGADTYVQGFIDRETIRNMESPSTAVVPDLQLTELEALRNRRDAFTVSPELEAPPQFLEGRVRSVGFVVNRRFQRGHAVSVRYRRADALQMGVRDGLAIPYIPRDYLRVSSHWSLPQRWLLGIHATGRGERFRDEANTTEQRIVPGWVFGLSSYWESEDKRWVLQGILDNLRLNRNSSDDRATRLILRTSYLF